MSGRIYSLTELFGIPERFLDTPEKAEALADLPPVDYSRPAPKFTQLKETSLKYLEQCLLQAKQ